MRDETTVMCLSTTVNKTDTSQSQVIIISHYLVTAVVRLDHKYLFHRMFCINLGKNSTQDVVLVRPTVATKCSLLDSVQMLGWHAVHEIPLFRTLSLVIGVHKRGVLF